MGIGEALALGMALGADSFTVSVSIGLAGVHMRRAIKLALLFGGLQGVLLFGGGRLAEVLHWLLTVVASGWGPIAQLARQASISDINSLFHVGLSLVGAGILVYIGVGLMRAYANRRAGEHPVVYRGRMALALLALSVSIDAFSAGLGLGMLDRINLPFVAVVVTVTTGGMAFLGLRCGKSIGRVIGRRAELAGGIILMILAVHIARQALMLP